MIVSEIQITLKSFGGNPVVHVVPFSSMDWAEKEYATLKELVKRMDDHANDLPTLMGLCTQIDNYIAGIRNKG